MKHGLIGRLCIIIGLLGLWAPLIDAAEALTLVRDYDALPGNAVDVSATSDSGNELSLSTFTTQVGAAYDAGNGGVLDFEGEIFYREREFIVASVGGGGELVLFDQGVGTGLTASNAASGRTAVSGDTLIATGGTNDFGITFGGNRALEAVGITVVSREGNPANVQVTAFFDNGGSVIRNTSLAGGNGVADTFFGFQAPVGARIVSLEVDISSSSDGANLPYLALDDLGVIIGTESLKTEATLYRLGQIEPRDSNDISASNFGVGGETMGRDYTVYANWKDYLAPLGAKKIRLQSGWEKTEQVPGVYDWAWLDAIIPDIAAMGAEPWVTLCYGNSIYTGGGNDQSSSPLPSSPEALEAWDNFVRAFVQRYQGYVDEWEIWNEPQHQGISLSDYVAFYIRTAEVIRSEQPEAQILGLSSAGISVSLTEDFLEALQAAGKLGLVNQITYHPYTYNPDSSYNAVASLKSKVNSYGAGITIRQGENGAPSEQGTTGALSNYSWTELSQAKWALRRLFRDYFNGVESSYFGIIDMWYAAEGVNRKGLIYSPSDKTAGHPKEAYFAVQHLYALIDSQVTPDPGLSVSVNHHKSVFKYGLASGGLPMVALWEDGATPTNTIAPSAVAVTVGATFEYPVYVDLRTGEISRIDGADWSVAGGSTTFQLIPVYDSPVLVAEAAAIQSMDREARAHVWQWQQFGDPEASEADWLADGDGDGKNNLFEAESGGDPTRNDAAQPDLFTVTGVSSIELELNDWRISEIKVQRSFDLSFWDTISTYDPDADTWSGDASVEEIRESGGRIISVLFTTEEAHAFYKLEFNSVPFQ